MCTFSVNTCLFAAFVLVCLVSDRLVQGFNFKSIHWTTHGSERLAELSEYEIVTPVRLDGHTGLPLPSDGTTRHFQKRSASFPLDSSSGGGEEEEGGFEEEPQATFLLGAFHQQFQLNLSRDSSFFSPSFVVEFLGDEGDEDAGDLDTSAPLHCFYRGVVNGQPESSAVFSLCDGMHGLFQTPEGTQYFVEPLEDSTSAEEGSTRPHLVYPTTALQDLNKNSGCGLTDEDFSPKEPSQNSTNDVPGPHGSHPRKHHHGDRRRFHSDDVGPANTLAAQLYQMHQRISKSIKQDSNSSKDASPTKKTDSPHRREKRFVSLTRHVELMVVADSKMLNHHGANLEHYLLTLVALVNKIFKDPSIGNDINIVLVKLLVLRREEENLSISSDAPETLRNFCAWQQEQNQNEDSHPHHYDTAVLITKEDICRSSFDCDTLGLAELGTMCDPFRSCSIVQDNGLSAAFTMAHEVGHVFNLPHDDNTKCQEFSENLSGKYGVMAPTLNYQINPWTWSRCSRNKITDYLDMGYGHCLLDSPRDAQELPTFQPGEVYNVSRQCELVFGEGSSVCPIMKTCSRLWCTGSSQGSQRGCRTQHMPWADGTPCGHNKWCNRGKCVARRHGDMTPVDGGWGKWEPYGECSRTCGGGVRQAIRRCVHPLPQNGGKYCVGRRARFGSCNSRPCPDGSIPFREEQCAAFNGNNLNIQGVPRDVRWVAKYTGIHLKDQCSLFCRVEGSIAFYKLGKKVVDGTPCGPDTDDICVQGHCWHAGCDHILGSKTTRDDCGICGGDNRACRTVRNTYNETRYGYNKVVEIPTGSTKLDIRQRSPPGIPEDDNYLAVKNSNGEFLLNGHFVVSMFQREVKIGNAVMQYSGSNNSTETITCYDKITSGISIYVLSVGNVLPPNIVYSYNIPIPGKEIYVWDMYGLWGSCSRMCKGEKQQGLRCLRQADRVQVKDSHCRGGRPQPFTSKCNTGCELRWEITAESDCSATCGRGRRTRRVECKKLGRRRQVSMVVAAAHCQEEAKPAEVVECGSDCEAAHWEYSAWSQCSRSCSSGTRRRSASCRDPNGYYAQDSNCASSSKLVVERCNTEPCPMWATESWNECSVTCGSGDMHRSVQCYQGNQMVDLTQCDLSVMPETTRPCRVEDCAIWHQGNWGPCSATCGQGTMQRLISCMVGDQEAEVTQCDLSLMPETTRSCEVNECPFWHQGEWSSCSVSCGQGEMLRLVSCYQGNYIVDHSRCDRSTIPESVAPCDMGECAKWLAIDWGPCSVTCGHGERQRQVSCFHSNQEVDNSHCVPDEKPALASRCQMQECAGWQHGEWSECSVTCSQGTQLRVVSCYRGNQVVHDNECDHAATPTTGRECHMTDCAVWKHGDWGECSGTCGQGEKQRFVGCYQGNQEVPPSQCDLASKPDAVTSCEMAACLTWHQGEWGPCSASCGEGERQRAVACYQGDREVDLGQCDLTLMPTNVSPCKQTECAYWQHGQWGPCSVTCDKGERRRSVDCHQDDQIGDGNQCDESLKPITVISCQMAECPDWKGADWGPCSVTCGQGTRQRVVNCYQGNQQADFNLCDPTMMLETVRPCEMIECTDWYQGEWGPCSVSCGSGETQRRVSCSQGGRNVDMVNCDLDSMPEAVRGCQMPECPEWRAGQWGQCSESCGQGTMQRQVDCYQGNSIVDLTQCDLTLRLTTSRECELDRCPVWRHGSWGPCSVSCGLGYQLRGIQCRHPNGTPVPDDQCSPDDQPPIRQDCRLPTCPAPTSPATDLPEMRSPVVQKPIPRTTAPAPVPTVLRRPSALTPRLSPRPPRPSSSQRSLADPSSSSSSSISVARRPSDPRPLPKSSPVTAMEVLREEPRRRYSSQWRTGMWTECSTTCGYGTRERYVSCRDRYGYISEERDCNTANRPAAIEQCQIKPCPHWRTGQWNRCSVTCGQGTTSRYVACVNGDSSIAVDEDCDLRHKPSETDVCSRLACPMDQPVASGMASEHSPAVMRGRWRTGQWSKCSSTCGSGLRQRIVICRDESGEARTCSEKSRPRNIEACNTGLACPLWSFGEWGQCSATCGGGVRSRLVLCRLRSGRTLADSSCNILARPEDTRICSANPCPTRHSWRTRPWSWCSVTCGTGTQLRLVTCQDEAGTVQDDEECQMAGEEQPTMERECREQECPRVPAWKVGDWRECSVSCGTGTQQRLVTCQDEAGTVQDDEECQMAGAEQPTMERECREQECPRVPAWKVGDWRECSVSCGTGTQQRLVTCQDEAGTVQDDEECQMAGEEQPTIERECREQECPQVPAWKLGEWRECSVSCGTGTQQRSVTCQDEAGTVQDDEECQMGGAEPPTMERECREQECPRVPAWKVGEWSECSVSCGTGTQQRSVTCQDEAATVQDDEECQMAGAEPPTMERECREQECPRVPAWKVGEWSECSVSCGTGTQQRSVTCQDEAGTVQDDEECQMAGAEQPTMERECREQECPRVPAWKVGEWRECSVSCGTGTQQRSVTCQDEAGTVQDDEECQMAGEEQPTIERECREQECPRVPAWKVGDWRECSVSCGTGTQQRLVTCQDEAGTVQDDEECQMAGAEQPTMERECREQECPRVPAWKVGDWRECSVSCGTGTQQRLVTCQDEAGTVQDDEECQMAGEEQPTIERECREQECPQVPAWKVGEWRECSVSCGTGTQQRSVTCQDEAGTVQDDEECQMAGAEPPTIERECREQECHRVPAWKVGEWRECSVSCGTGTQQRLVTCQDEAGTVQDDEECQMAGEEQPTMERECREQECPRVPAWKVGEWSECSVSCGTGTQQRLVTCQDEAGTVQDDEECQMAGEEQPTMERECREQECPRVPAWKVGDWRECSVSCGTGTQQRSVTCQDEAGTVQDDEECQMAGEEQPTMERECREQECHRVPAWKVGEWRECSVSCGTGTQQRSVTCQDEAGTVQDDEECQMAGAEQPTMERECREQECHRVPAWKVGKWSACSVTCGAGSRQRTAACEDEAGIPMPEEDCERGGSEKPETRIQCRLADCSRSTWSAGPWRECSVTCGSGWQNRTITCQDEAGEVVPDPDCEIGEATKPDAQRECQVAACPGPRWNVGDWNDCSTTCGLGFRERRVVCIDEVGEEFEDHECELNDTVKPATRRGCQQVECLPSRPSWSVGDWSKCSVTCGVGTRERTVTCQDHAGVRPPAECEVDGVPRPATHTDCQQADCPRLRPKWKVGNWSECSVTCGKGSRRRMVRCEDQARERRAELECEREGSARPTSVKECRLRTCPRPKWIVTQWSECSVTCDQGLRVREASCQLADAVVEDSLCLRKKPKMSKKCRRDKCMKYRWKKGRWSQCSKSCGGGYKLRKVHCTDSKDNEVDNRLCSSQNRPRDDNKCNTHDCDAPRLMWLAGPWGECSHSCGPGQEKRHVSCRAFSPDGWAMPTDDKACRQESRPKDTRPCFVGRCALAVHWRMGPWSMCSKECGGGIKERKVQCRDHQGKRQPGGSCGPPTIRPETRDVCNHEPCQPESCHDIQRQRSLHEDDEYSILVWGKPLTVYCHGMTTDEPTEYVSLAAGEGENFAEIYPKRLIRATQCPYHGNRNDDCECTDDGHRAAGLTTFTKLRLNTTSMEIIISDPTFAVVHHGQFVPYATAGDCYSSADCPQGQFHINLTGTRLALAPEVDWATEGYAVSRRLARDELNQRVAGRCGGFCGTCFPDKRRGGLRVTFVS